MSAHQSVVGAKPAMPGFVALVMIVLAACAVTPSATVTPSPAASPSRSITPPTPGDSSSASSLPSPTPTPSPAAVPPRWVAAGDVTRDLPGANLVALPGGGALLIGIEIEERGEQISHRMATERWEPATAEWLRTQPLERMRSSFASVALRDGGVLVAGGFNERDASYSSSYVFDPATEAWAKTGSLTVARTHPGTALLSDGRVLVVGGYYYAPEPEPTMPPEARLAGWGAAAPDPMSEGRVPPYDVDIPPIGRALATAELFDPSTGTWTRTGSMRYARTGPAVTTLSDGRVLVVGSTDDNVHIDDRAYRTAEIFDPTTGRFTAAATLPAVEAAAILERGVDLPDFPGLPGSVGSLVALPDGGAALIGHQEWWKHEAELVRSFRLGPDGRAWHDIGEPYAWTGGELPSRDTGTVSRRDAVVARLQDGSVLVAGGSIGGETGWGEGDRPPVSAETYDPREDRWMPLPDLPGGRFSPSAVGLADGSVLVVGGDVLSGSGEEVTVEWGRAAYRFVPRH